MLRGVWKRVKGGSWAQESGWKRCLSAVSVSSTVDCTDCSVCLSGIGWPRSARAAKRGNRCSRRPADTEPRLRRLITAGRAMETSPLVTPPPWCQFDKSLFARLPRRDDSDDCVILDLSFMSLFIVSLISLLCHRLPVLAHYEPGSGVGCEFWAAGQVFWKRRF